MSKQELLWPCCLVHDDDPCPQSDTGHTIPCNGPGAPGSCDFVTVPHE